MLALLDIYLSNVEGASFMCLTSISTHIVDWKSFMKFGTNKSHEMISYKLSRIALLSELHLECYIGDVSYVA
jgi:hypothetical protein